MSQRFVSLFLAALMFSSCLPADDTPCPAIGRPPRVGEAATADSLRGVVELRTIATNPLPWGQSVEAVTRVWGDVVVERLVISGRRFEPCPDVPASDIDRIRYRFVGLEISGADDELRPLRPLDDDEMAPLDDNLGPPVAFTVSTADRVISALMVWWAEALLALFVTGLMARLVVARRRRRDDRRQYLF